MIHTLVTAWKTRLSVLRNVRTSLQGQVSRLCRAEVVNAHVESVSRLGAGNGDLLHKGAGKLT